MLSLIKPLPMVRTNPANPHESGASQPATPAASEMKYEAAVDELEQIVQNMEAGQLPLEESIAAYRRGCELLKYCQQQLSDAERKIQVLEDGSLREFDTAGGEAQ